MAGVPSKSVWFEWVGGTAIVKPFEGAKVAGAAHGAAAARLYLFRPARSDADDAAPPKPGTVCLTELRTEDPTRPLSFYGEVLGYTRAELADALVRASGDGVLTVPLPPIATKQS